MEGLNKVDRMKGVAFLLCMASAFVSMAVTPKEEAMAELRRMAESPNFYYAVRVSEKTGVDTVAKKAGIRTKVWYTDLAAVSGTWRQPEWYESRRKSIAEMVKRRWAEDRAIVVFTWHMENPYVPPRWRYEKNHSSDAFRFKPGVKGFPEEHTRLLAEILNGTGAECGTGTVDGKKHYKPSKNPREWFDRLLKQQADFLKGLVDKNGRRIPVVIRYLHESDGGWFPWGYPYATAEEFKAICRMTCDYLRSQVGDDSLLFAYTPDRFWKPFGKEGDTENTFLARYPGDGYVDVIGIDDYSIGTGETDKKAQWRHRCTVKQLRELSEFAAKRGKVACISETGCKKGRDDYHTWLLKACTAKGVNVAFAATWGGVYSIPSTEAGLVDWRKFLDDPRVITIKIDKKGESK